jgi:hypothetical protein
MASFILGCIGSRRWWWLRINRGSRRGLVRGDFGGHLLCSAELAEITAEPQGAETFGQRLCVGGFRLEGGEGSHRG